ncbi:MAG: hypothetical protein R2865_07995 [Deinococcales bacterium]
MHAFVAKRAFKGETRIALTPKLLKKLIKLGLKLSLEKGLGDSLYYPDSEYEAIGASISETMPADSDMVIRLNPPSLEEVASLKKGMMHLSLLETFSK